jgi:hypothetical protein
MECQRVIRESFVYSYPTSYRKTGKYATFYNLIPDLFYKILTLAHIYGITPIQPSKKGNFNGTISDFIFSNNINHNVRSTIYALVAGKRKTAWGWTIIT